MGLAAARAEARLRDPCRFGYASRRPSRGNSGRRFTARGARKICRCATSPPPCGTAMKAASRWSGRTGRDPPSPVPPRNAGRSGSPGSRGGPVATRSSSPPPIGPSSRRFASGISGRAKSVDRAQPRLHERRARREQSLCDRNSRSRVCPCRAELAAAPRGDRPLLRGGPPAVRPECATAFAPMAVDRASRVAKRGGSRVHRGPVPAGRGAATAAAAVHQLLSLRRLSPGWRGRRVAVRDPCGERHRLRLRQRDADERAAGRRRPVSRRPRGHRGSGGHARQPRPRRSRPRRDGRAQLRKRSHACGP